MRHLQNQFRYFLLPFLLLVLAETLLAQPANDNCSGAILLTSSTTCNLTSGSNVNATLSANDCNGGNNSNDDVWYRFVASSTSHTITVGSSTLDMVLDLRSGTCNGTTVECVNEQGMGVAESQEYTNLTIGATYYIRVFTFGPNTGAFTICVTHPPAPANDNCAGAITLTPSTNCSNTAGTTVGATNSIMACGGFGSAAHDVWYRFVATATGHRIIGSSSTLDLVLNPRSGACNGGGIGCFNNAGVGGTETVDLTGLTVGAAYFIRVYTMESGTGGAFNICVANIPAPSNDECAGAISLNSSTSCSTSSGSTLGATQSITACGAGSADDDVWYKFTAVTYSHTVTVASTNLDMVVQTFSGACPGTPISCVNATGDGGTESAVMTGLTPGATYYVRLYSVETGTPGTFTICVTHASGSPNDDCSNAILLTSQTTCVTTTATSGGATQSLPACGSGSNADDDVWFKFVAISSSHTVRVTAEGFVTEVDVRSGACNGTSIACASTPFLLNNISTVTVTPPGLIPGNTYYVRVYNEAVGSGTFDICVTHPTPPGNDDCAGATTLTSAGTCTTTTGTTVNATQSLTACGSGTADDDVWYKFVATVTAHGVTVSSTGLDIVFDVRSGACNGTSIACVNATGSGGTETTTLTGLTIGNTYYVRVYSVQASGGGSFNICVTGLTNDNCSNAILLTSALTCANTAGTTLGATQSLPDCSGGNTSDDDVWYRFVATATGHVVTASSASLDLVVDVRSGACNGSSMACVNATGTGGTETTTLYGLTVGTTYYIRVYSAQTSGGGTFNICVTVAAPVNDNCTGAILLTSSTTCVTTTGTTVAATQSLPDCSGGNNSDDDVWYQFVAVSPNHRVTVSSTLNMVVDVRSGACNGTSLVCQSISGAGVDEVVNLTDLTVGATYYIRVFSVSPSNTGTFTICVVTLPANDECTGAITVTSNNACTPVTGNTTGATQSLTACAVTTANDLWYQFVAVSSTHTVTASSTTLDLILNVRGNTGSCPGNTAGCVNNTGVGGTETVTLNSLVVGSTYYVRVFSSDPAVNGSFSLCVTHPPANDDCTGAFLLTSNTSCVTTTGSTTGATQSIAACAVTTANDVWYQFVAVSPSQTITVSSATLNLVLNVRSSSGSCPGTSLNCVNNTGTGGTETSAYGNLTVGSTYYVRVFNEDPNVSGSFTVCVTHVPIPANDDCVGAFTLTPGTGCTNTTGTTVAATQSLPDCSGGNTSDDDVWFKFVATSTSHTVRLTPPGPLLDLVFEIRTGACNGTSLVCQNSAGAGATEQYTLTGLTVGATYYVRVFSADSGRAPFDICVSTPPANDECAGALSVTSNTSCVTTNGSTAGATQSLAACGTGNSDDDVWYKFTAVYSTQTVTVSSAVLNLVLNVRGGTGTCPGNDLACVNATGTGGTETTTLSNLTVGATYYVRIYSFENNVGGPFTICVTHPAAPVNNECAGAITLTSSPTCTVTNGTTLGATESLTACVGTGTADDDVWYKFVAVTSAHTVTVSSTAFDVVINVRSGACTGADLGCFNATTSGTETASLTGLTAGDTYLVRIYSQAANTTGAFTVCVTHPLPANDECTGAVNLTPTAGTFANPGTQTNEAATQTTPGVNCPGSISVSNVVQDVWYRFTTNGSGGTVNISATPLNGTGNPLIHFFAGCNTGPVSCNDQGGPGATETLTIAGVGASSTYYFRVYGQNSPSFPFTVELTGSAITGPLPLELSSFSGKINGGSNVLQWETLSEKNVEWHLVERSVDAVKWTEIGRRAGQADAQQPTQYTFEDVAPLPRSYYRLRSVDYDGQESYSHTVALTREKELFGVVAAYPSPASDWITVQLFTRQEETVELRVTDVSGRLVQVQRLEALAGGNELKLAVQQLQPGVYLLQAHNGRDASTPLRFVKQ